LDKISRKSQKKFKTGFMLGISSAAKQAAASICLATNCKIILALHGASLKDVVKMTIFSPTCASS
jgi:hypothetical protein